MDRISELTRIARERDLTPDEQAERKALRVVGFQEAEIFGKVLDSALKNPPQNPL